VPGAVGAGEANRSAYPDHPARGADDLPHQDPVDRFLVASAIVYDLTLVTADRRLLRSRAVPTLAG